jgi:type IV secretory pathway TraG/TraD family ATPase VirD4
MGELVVPGSQPGRVLLGRLAPGTTAAQLWGMVDADRASPALAAPASYGVLIVGPTRSGKTTSLLSPAVVGWDGPVIATSIRSDVLQHSWEAREEQGWPVLIYNPSNQGDYGSNTWSPLAAVMGDRPWASARRTARALVEAAGLAERGANRREDFWNMAAADYIAPLLLAAAADGPSMERVMVWLQKGDGAKKEVRARLKDHPEARQAADGVWALEPKISDSIYLTARTTLSAYQDEEVLKTCQSGMPGELPDITPDAVLGTEETPGASLFVVSPPTEWKYFAPLFSALVTSLVDAAFRRSGGLGQLDPPLLLALDEVANIAPLDELPAWASMSAGAGIQVVTVLQDLGQAERIWGKESTRSLLANHPAKLILGGTTDLETLRWAQELAGETEVQRWRQTRGRGGRSASEDRERRPLLSLEEIRRIPKGAALLISESAPAAIVKLRQGTTI